MNKQTSQKTDVLIIGSGLAGMLLAVELANAQVKVTIVSKRTLSDSNTNFAQGGLAAVVPESIVDSPELHLQDTVKAGAGLTDSAVAALIIKEGAQLVKKLSELGVGFDYNGDGTCALALEGGHCRPRVLHSKDTTGNAIARALVAQVRSSAYIAVRENTLAVDLIVKDGICVGAYLLDDSSLQVVSAGRVVLATGGTGQIFERTTNPAVATGDGIAIAWRAGAVLSDLEFVQFHPTALYKPGAPAFLISEAVRGAGAVLVDADGHRFMKRFHPDAELATRDIVARAIYSTMTEMEQRSVWLDLRPIGADEIAERFPNIVTNCQSWGVDPLSEPIPVCPAAHYFMGGIWTNANGATTLPSLYAIGECASVGLHGANRLASNSLLEAGVMALRVARHILRTGIDPILGLALAADDYAFSFQLPVNLRDFRRAMYRYAGLERDEAGLTELFDYLSESTVTRQIVGVAECEAANMLQLGQLIALSAMSRRESRGAHWRSDYPEQDDRRFGRRQYIGRSDVEEMVGKPFTPDSLMLCLPAGETILT
jgi:L-aspartate oxidase